MHATTQEEGAAPLWRSILAAAAGNLLEWYDFVIYAFMAPYIVTNFFPSTDPYFGLLAVFITFGLGFVARPLGGVLIGKFGDAKGRKAALLLTIFLMAVGTAGMGLLPSRAVIGEAAPWLLLICRLIQGFSAGGEWASATTFIYEWAPKERSGFFSSLQQSSVACGMLLGSAVGGILTSLLNANAMNAFGWRIPFLLGALILPVGLYTWRQVAETPVFRNRQPARLALGAGLRLALRAIGITVIWTVAYYTILTYMPVFTAEHASMIPAAALWSNALSLLILALATPGFGSLADRVGRKPLLLTSTIGFALLTYPLLSLIVHSRSILPVVLAQIVFALLTAIYSGAAPAAMNEIFPPAGRLLWMSTGYSLATALFGGFGPAIATWLIKTTGSPLSPAFYIMGGALLSLLAILPLKETRDG